LNGQLNAFADYEIAEACQADDDRLEEYIPFHNLHYIKIIGSIYVVLRPHPLHLEPMINLLQICLIVLKRLSVFLSN
jgi:hypothetical protein